MNQSTRNLAAERFERVCRENGLPLTIQRRVVYETLVDAVDHPTADEIYHRVCTRTPGIAHTTVYRVLETFVRVGLARRIHHPHSVARYEGNISRHDHLRCVVCHRVVDVESPALDHTQPPPDNLQGFTVHGYTIVYDGTCPACRERAASPSSEEEK